MKLAFNYRSRLRWLTAVGFALFMGVFPFDVSAVAPPIITGFSPAIGPIGSTIVISGSNFIIPLNVTFGSNVTASGTFTSTAITVTVPSGAASGDITVKAAGGTTTTASAFVVGTNAPATFFNGEVALGSGVDYLQFTNGTIFGYYSYVQSPTLYHFDIGYLYFFDANNSDQGAYFYDYASTHFWYTSPTLFPYVYDFTLNSFLYYYPNTASPGHYTTNPRYFFNFATGKIITQ